MSIQITKDSKVVTIEDLENDLYHFYKYNINWTWEEFLSDTIINDDGEISYALKEYTYIVKKYLYAQDSKYKRQYDTVLNFLIKDIDTTVDYLPTLNNNSNEITNNILIQNSGIVAETCYYFAFFYLCKQLAYATGYAADYSKTTGDDYKNVLNCFIGLDKCFTKDEGKKDQFINNRKSGLKKSHISKVLKMATNLSNVETTSSVYDPLLPLGNYDAGNHTQGFSSIIEQLKGGKNTKEKIDIFFGRIKPIKKGIIDWYTKSLFRALTNGKTPPQSTMIAVGDGSQTTSVLKIGNLGCLLFNYTITNGIPASTIPTPPTSIPPKIKIYDRFHLSDFGQNKIVIEKTVDKTTIAFTEIIIDTNNNLIIKFKANPNIYNGLRPYEYTRSYPNFISINYSKANDIENESIIETIQDVEISGTVIEFRDSSNILKAKFDRLTNDLIFERIFNVESVNITVKAAKNNSDTDEVQLIVNSVKNFNDSIFYKGDNLYDSDIFILNNTNANIDVITKRIVKYLINGYSFNFIELYGGFVGEKIVNDNVDADENYYPTIVLNNKTKESSLKELKPVTEIESSKNPLRYSSVEFNIDDIAKTIDIEIVSFTSPNPAYLLTKDTNIKLHPTESDLSPYTISDYVIDNPDTYGCSYNQALAMLRSMGMFKAIVEELKNLLDRSSNTNINLINAKKTELDNALNNAVSYDKTFDFREDYFSANITSIKSDLDMSATSDQDMLNLIKGKIQITNGISYNTFKKFANIQ